MIRLGLIGHPVAHSRSPAVHQTYAAQLGLHVDYRLIDVEAAHLSETILELRGDGYTGLNITLPHKIAAASIAAQLSANAAAIGAVNSLRLTDLYGDNTDGAGLLEDLEGNLHLSISGRDILVLGASGAARAAIAALLPSSPASLTIANRDLQRAGDLAALHDCITVQAYADLDLSRFDLILNATSASLRQELPPLPETPFAGAAYDLVTLDQHTVFQTWAMAAGARLAADGWGMLVEQAALSWVIWGLPKPDPKALLKPERVMRA